ncbi:hypothetical protein [uncultured Ferrovibrio sp.]|jgi:hypothetical protein|uniref:hypothetical protein n=1 Tax=uncultured Ferrovibrio sp. TaxID=1576913 RepID=UPI002630F367|nr:hypothetical protein [uncultured Ferrovibrio sp.]
MTSKDAEAADPRIRWLKAVVIGLGVIFVGLAVLLIVLIMTGGYKRSAPAAAPSSTAEAVQDFGITLPRNSRVAEVLATNSRIVLRVRLADGTERLYALDGESLRLLGSVTIQVER